MPTEEEWEWACRGGNSARFCFGDDARYAKYFAHCNGEQTTLRVARQMPNWYGIFDMHGGLWEWCDSRYEDKYAEELGLPDAEWYMKRGGAWYSPAVRCRCTQRNYGDPSLPDQYFGVRLVMEFDKS